MLPAAVYLPTYCFGLLALTLLTTVIYMRPTTDFSFAVGFNRLMLPSCAAIIILFIGLRPLSWLFVDMGTYVAMYSRARAGEKVTGDWGFDELLSFFAERFEVEYFFLFCAFLYIAPLAFAAARRHGEWAWSPFLALLGGFSFFNYGVNGIRHGVAASLIIAAFSTRQNKVVTALLVVMSFTIHKSVVITGIAFVIASLISRPGIWAAIWMVSAILVAIIGERVNAFIFNLLPAIEDLRAESYLLQRGEDKGGYRWDFLLYSSVPVIVSYALAQTRIRAEKEYRVLLSTYIITNTFWVLVIYAGFSNRFAYLSWSFLPWLVIYPFVGTQRDAYGNPGVRPQLVLLGGALIVHFSFTFAMSLFYA